MHPVPGKLHVEFALQGPPLRSPHGESRGLGDAGGNCQPVGERRERGRPTGLLGAESQGVDQDVESLAVSFRDKESCCRPSDRRVSILVCHRPNLVKIDCDRLSARGQPTSVGSLQGPPASCRIAVKIAIGEVRTFGEGWFGRGVGETRSDCRARLRRCPSSMRAPGVHPDGGSRLKPGGSLRRATTRSSAAQRVRVVAIKIHEEGGRAPVRSGR